MSQQTIDRDNTNWGQQADDINAMMTELYSRASKLESSLSNKGIVSFSAAEYGIVKCIKKIQVWVDSTLNTKNITLISCGYYSGASIFQLYNKTDSVLVGSLVPAASALPTGLIEYSGKINDHAYISILFDWSAYTTYFSTTDSTISLKLNAINDNSFIVQFSDLATATSLVSTSRIVDLAVTPDKTSFFETGINKFNYLDADIKRGFYLSSAGVTQTNASYTVSGYIPITAGLSVICNLAQLSAGTYHWQYDANFALIPGSGVNMTKVVTGVTDCAWVRYTINLTSTADISAANIQVEYGTVSTSYVPYGKRIVASKHLAYNSILAGHLTDNAVENKHIKDQTISQKKLSFTPSSSNLFNYEDADIKRGFYLSSVGATQTSANYTVSGYIPITAGQSVICNQAQLSTGTYHWQYDANFALIPGSGVNMTKVVTGVAGCAWVRYTMAISSSADIVKAAIQIEVGSVSTAFKAYRYIPRQLIESNTILVFLPSEICIASGRTIEIYNSQVSWCGNVNDHHYYWSGIGKCMKRKWSCTGTDANIGTYTLSLQIFDRNNVLVGQASTTVKIVSNVIANNISIAPIGDSLTNQKAWETEIISLSANKISLVGTRWGNATGIGDTYRHEGRSGVTPSWYLANSSYTFDSKGNNGADGRSQSLNPFWNPNTGTVDFGYYKSNYNLNPNKIMIWLGTNGISTDPAAAVGQIKSFIDAIRLNSSTIPIFVVFTLFRADQNGIGVQTGVDGYAPSSTYKLVEDYKVFVLQTALYAALSAYSNLFFIPVSLCHDSEYNFGADVVPVNPRASQTETIPYEATHPQNQGYMQIADIIFSSIAAHQ